jgi:hypothetical protein
MSKSKKKAKKQRYDLWILNGSVVRIAESNLSAKKCKQITHETELNKGEAFLMTPVSSEAYCPLAAHNLA